MALLILKHPTPQRLRIIDGLIAEHLFNWKWFCALGGAYLIPPFGYESIKSFSVHWTEGLVEDTCTGTEHIVKRCEKRYDIDQHYSNYKHMALPRYTTNKEAAFDVIQELAHRTVTLSLMYTKPYKPPWQVHTAAANSLELAVCLYALDHLKIKLPWSSKPPRREKAASLNTVAA